MTAPAPAPKKKIQIVHTRDAAWAPALTQGNYANRRKPLAGEKLSGGLWELAPGKKSFPMHAHSVTEEAMFVVSGKAKVRTPDATTEVGPGDWVSFPAGGEAHQLINDGGEPFVYLALSVSQGVDIVEYPETGKLAAAFGAPGSGKRWIFRESEQIGYFDGDKDA